MVLMPQEQTGKKTRAEQTVLWTLLSARSSLKQCDHSSSRLFQESLNLCESGPSDLVLSRTPTHVLDRQGERQGTQEL